MNIKVMHENRKKTKLRIGDWVIYWHKRMDGKSLPDVGKIIDMNPYHGLAILEYGDGNTCERRVNGITKISEGEAMLFTLERDMTPVIC